MNQNKLTSLLNELSRAGFKTRTENFKGETYVTVLIGRNSLQGTIEQITDWFNHHEKAKTNNFQNACACFALIVVLVISSIIFDSDENALVPTGVLITLFFLFGLFNTIRYFKR